jgi:translation initiation factor IF-3
MAKKPFKKEPEHILNERIRGHQVRVVGDDIEGGVFLLKEALELAKEMELDLILINPNANPPVCRLADYGKFLYERKKKLKEQEKNTVKVVVKEVKFTPNTDTNDFNFKAKHALEFLKEGKKVKASVFFRGREMAFKERGEIMLLNLAKEVEEYGIPESMPKLEGKNMIMLIKPKPIKN